MENMHEDMRKISSTKGKMVETKIGPKEDDPIIQDRSRKMREPLYRLV